MTRTDFLLAARRLALPVAAMFLVLTGTGCNGSKAFTKRGAKMEEAGMMEQAAGFYFTAVQKDKMNTEAMQGLRRTGQWVLNDRLTAFDGAMLRDEKAAAVKAYEEADAYFKKVDALGVRLDFPETKRMAYSQVKNSHMDDLYRAASRALEDEKFDAALTDLTEILRLDPPRRPTAPPTPPSKPAPTGSPPSRTRPPAATKPFPQANSPSRCSPLQTVPPA